MTGFFTHWLAFSAGFVFGAWWATRGDTKAAPRVARLEPDDRLGEAWPGPAELWREFEVEEASIG